MDEEVILESITVAGQKIIITAERCERLGTWYVTCRVGGVLHDIRPSNDPLSLAKVLAEEAIDEWL